MPNEEAILNKTYDTYVKPILKYGSEQLVSNKEEKMDFLERTQSRILGIITGAVKITPIVVMQCYISNPPTAMEFQETSRWYIPSNESIA